MQQDQSLQDSPLPQTIQSVVILGRQPKLGLAELESLFGSEAVHPIAPNIAGLTVAPEDIPFARLGGSIKLAHAIHLIRAHKPTAWPKIERCLQKLIIQQLQHEQHETHEPPSHLSPTLPRTPVPSPALLSAGKLKLGLSVYGDFGINPAKLNATALTLKKAIRNRTERSVRIVPNNEDLALNSAQVLHNGLTSRNGREFLIIKGNRDDSAGKNKNKDMFKAIDTPSVIIAQTVAEQDIGAYAARDQGRPKRDARVGMLPPKLAQIIINLSGTQPFGTLWDPFCGTGVILQEALLMEIDVYGSDIDPRMIEYTHKNLEWLDATHGVSHGGPLSIWYDLRVGDATTITFKNKHTAPLQAVACESYLGQPFSTFPSADKLAEVRSTCNLILKKFLQNIAPQVVSGTRLCLAVPAWQQKPGVYTHVPTLDHLKELGYNRVSFKYVEPEDLIYARADQIVARELLVLIRQ